jgi:hypothetical protein
VPVIGIFGPNASGKSNIIDALVYMSRMVRGSLRESEPGAGIDRHPFALDPDMADEPSSYVIDLLLGDVRYTYGFAINDMRVVEEWMYSYPHKRQRTIFHRRGDEYTYGEHSPESMRRVEEITDPSVLFLSVAARSKQELVQPVYGWFTRLQMRSSSAARLHRPFFHIAREVDRSGFLERLTLLLQAADTGIESAELVEETEEELAARYASARAAPPKDVRLPRNQELVLRHRGAQLLFTSHDPTLLGRIQGEEVLQRDHV